MWLVAKFNTGESEIFKDNLNKSIGFEVEYYQPKIILEYNNKKFFKYILGNYIFCKHFQFADDKIINSLKFIRGLKYFLSNYKLEQKQIFKFIKTCKSHEKDDKTLRQSFFDELIQFNAKFTAGPFKNLVCDIISKNKNYFVTKINNLKITVKKKENYFLSF